MSSLQRFELRRVHIGDIEVNLKFELQSSLSLECRYSLSYVEWSYFTRK